MRDVGIGIIRAVGVESGGCNIQFAINPADGRMIVIEMNPRVSRSSALASKATGFPIAKIAAKVAIGYTLDEIPPNDITGETPPASFEPSLDYVIVKVPPVRLREVPDRRHHADHAHEVGRRGDGDRSQLRRGPGQGAALDGGPAGALQLCRHPRRRRRRSCCGSHRPRPTAGSRPCSPRSAPVPASRRSSRPPRSIPGSSPRSPPWSTWPRRSSRPAGSAPSCSARPSRTASPTCRSRSCGGADRVRGPRDAARARDPPGVQDRRHLCRRVRRPDALPLLLLRRGDRGRHPDQAGGDHPGQRPPQPDRAGGDRVRLLLRACLDGAARGRVRDGDGQLQPPRPSRPTTTPPTGSTSNRSPWRTCWRWCTPNGRPARWPGG